MPHFQIKVTRGRPQKKCRVATNVYKIRCPCCGMEVRLIKGRVEPHDPNPVRWVAGAYGYAHIDNRPSNEGIGRTPCGILLKGKALPKKTSDVVCAECHTWLGNSKKG